MSGPVQIVTQQSEKISFGKYKGQTFAWIIGTDPGYILWLNQGIVQMPQTFLADADDSLRAKATRAMKKAFRVEWKD